MTLQQETMYAPCPCDSVPGTLLSPSEVRWYAAYIVTRHEKVVAQQLLRRGLETFLPLYRATRRWKNRRAHVELPLFPGYLFLRIGIGDRVRALEVPSVVHIVSVRGEPVAVPDGEIENLRTAMQLRTIEPCSYIASGKRIRIKAGPLQGLEGFVVRQNSRTRMIVSVDFIQRSTAVELWPEDLEYLPDMTSADLKESTRAHCSY
jgi:transcription antitermination factor NusG